MKKSHHQTTHLLHYLMFVAVSSHVSQLTLNYTQTFFNGGKPINIHGHAYKIISVYLIKNFENSNSKNADISWKKILLPSKNSYPKRMKINKY